MKDSVFDAIRNGHWDFEPKTVPESEFSSTCALPGTAEKVDILAARVSAGLPLWHSCDRLSYDDSEQAWR